MTVSPKSKSSVASPTLSSDFTKVDDPSVNTQNSTLTKTSSLSDWLNYMQQIHVSAIDMGLSRVIPVANQLGLIDSAKHDAYVFTVAGTNGKGSTTAVISEICHQAGYKTALYQSPHLIDFNERIRINGQPVGDKVLISAFYEVEQARLLCELTLSFFEMTTLAAMLVFMQAKCDVWVLEVGLGGRLDVVNIIDPDLAVITNIGIDHVDWLGDTRDKIGLEKAGILRQGVPLIYGEEDMPDSIRQQITEQNVPCWQAGRDFSYISEANDAQWQFSAAAITLQLPKPALSLINAANGVAAALTSHLDIEPTHINDALSAVRLDGRFDYRQLIDRHWLFDVAHNDRGVRFLLSQFVPLWQNHKATLPNARLHLVFSMLVDKDIVQVVRLLLSSGLPIDSWHIAEIDYPRAATVDQLQSILDQANANSICIYNNLSECAQGVITQSKSDDLILVCGSFHTIGEVLQFLDKQLLT